MAKGRGADALIGGGFDRGLALWQGARHFNGDANSSSSLKIAAKVKAALW
jgi:hypothetical protein